MSMLGITWQGSVTGEATGIAILCVWAKKGKDKGAGQGACIRTSGTRG